jgi:hypothetical protein
MATKTKASPKKKSAPKTSVTLEPVPWRNTEVQIFSHHEVTVEAAAQSAPIPNALKKVKASDTGTLALKGLKPGQYTAAGETDAGWRYLNFTVRKG